MDIDEVFKLYQNKIISAKEKNNITLRKCPNCGEFTFLTDNNTLGACVNCGYDVYLKNNVIKEDISLGIFLLVKKQNFALLNIIDWNATIDNLPKSTKEIFNCTIDELDYCILHSIKHGNIDFKGML